MRPASKPSFGLFAGLAVLALLAAPAAEAGPYREGMPLEIIGTVTDSAGLPIPDVTVALEVRRRAFSIKKFERTTRDTVRVTAMTDARGEYTIPWRWYDYYNRFEVNVGVPIRKPEGEHFQVLASVDIGKRIKQGSPVIANLVVEDTGFVESLRDFVASVETADQQEVYGEMGKPDRVQIIQYPGFDEVTWWYFRAGKAYRFREGRLDRVEAFDPVSPFRS